MLVIMGSNSFKNAVEFNWVPSLDREIKLPDMLSEELLQRGQFLDGTEFFIVLPGSL